MEHFCVVERVFLCYFVHMKKVSNEAKKCEFARLIVSGANPHDAYRQAYGRTDKKKLKEISAKSAAYRLLKDDFVCAEIDRLKAAADTRAVMTRQEVLERLSRKIATLDESGDTKNMVACVAELNRMMGNYEPARVEVKNDIVHDFVRDQISRASSEPIVKPRAGV